MKSPKGRENALLLHKKFERAFIFMIYFDNAATTGKKPDNVIKAVEYSLKNYSANPGRSGHMASVKTAEAVYKVREKIADFFGADGAENVVFTLNCTHSINCVIKGILRKGDHVVVSSLEHNAVMRPLVKSGVSYTIAEVNMKDDEITLQNFKNKIKANTKLVICTGASNVFGKILPIGKIGKICKEKGVFFAVDGAQIAGVLPINMAQQNIDFLCIAPHKGLYAPMGVGALIARKHINETIIEGGTGTNSLEMSQPEMLPERLESGTVNVSGIMGISAGVDFVKKMGIERLYLKELELTQKLYKGLKMLPKIILYTEYPKVWSFVPVISFNVEGLSSEKTAVLLSNNGVFVRGGLHCAPFAHRQMGTLEGGTVRISVSAFNNYGEIDALLQILKEKIIKK